MAHVRLEIFKSIFYQGGKNTNKLSQLGRVHAIIDIPLSWT